MIVYIVLFIISIFIALEAIKIATKAEDKSVGFFSAQVAIFVFVIGIGHPYM